MLISIWIGRYCGMPPPATFLSCGGKFSPFFQLISLNASLVANKPSPFDELNLGSPRRTRTLGLKLRTQIELAGAVGEAIQLQSGAVQQLDEQIGHGRFRFRHDVLSAADSAQAA